jgi:hypothetical protein
MRAQFFDLSVLIELESKVWLVSRTKPSIPIVKISTSEFNLIKKGVYVKFGQKMKIGGSDYWLSKDLSEEIKIKCVKSNTDISDLVFSMQEYMNPSIIEKLNYTIHKDNLYNIKNVDDDIYIICSKNTKKNYDYLIKKLEEFLESIGLKVKNYYYISETYFNRNEDDICHKKVRLLLQHLIGLKTEGDKFIEEEITKYDIISYYDESKEVIEMCKNINDTLLFLQKNSEESISEKVKNLLKSDYTELIVNEVTFNRVNKFIATPVKITTQNIIKNFESFKFRG